MTDLGPGGRPVARTQSGYSPLDAVPHSTEKPCPRCRIIVKGSELETQRLYHDPKLGGCGHYHAGKCPEIRDA